MATKPLAHGHRGDWYLMTNCRLMLADVRKYKKTPNWVIAMSLFATGSNSARQICFDANIDPDAFTIVRPTTKD